ncbi:uncharacterized protein LOC131646838 [Vicia villosa]|uniref:uncharacterized protein LOC131646838 n=1 Tax=Vicia villosa TaxID=3911 RepID=UPI00273BD690|nr:uncharacterized protein LOC131646838 [Vicia villosa]
MPPLGKRSRSEIQNLPPLMPMDDHQSKISQYELSREERIRENRERMGKLGIFDISLSLKLKSTPPSRRTSSNPKSPIARSPSGPSRRSSRLQNVAPISYSEAPLMREVGERKTRVVIEEGSKPEVYTEEHEKLLGNTERTWELFVDGVGKDGRRIYDSVQGKTCHQCRQKTLGRRTRCCECNMVQGQFCGDCLYMRYGEHVLEALADPTWKCPPCRGICNCSLCRTARGWAPTGNLYRKVVHLGYKSVAHYLIQTRRAEAVVEKNDDTSSPVSDTDVKKNDDDVSNTVSAKRSLPFSDADNNENKLGPMQSPTETDSDEVAAAKRLLIFPDEQVQLEKVEGGLDTPDEQVQLEKVEGGSDTPDEQVQLEKVEGGSDTVKLIASASKPSPDSIAGRLRSRTKKP